MDFYAVLSSLAKGCLFPSEGLDLSSKGRGTNLRAGKARKVPDIHGLQIPNSP